MKSNIKILIFFLIINCQLSIVNYAQVGINDDGSSPDASAILDIKSTNKGMLIPRMSTTNRTNISNPTKGLLVFDNMTTSFWFFDGTNWVEMSNSSITLIQDADKDTKIQVEESTDEDKIRLDIKGEEHFILEANQLRVNAEELSGDNLSLFFDSRSSTNGSVSINEIRNILPTSPIDNSSNKIQFYIKHNKTLELSGDGAITVNNNYTLPTNDGTANQVLKTDGSGNVDWLSVDQTVIKDTDNNTKIQVEKNADDDMIRFDIDGSEALTISKNTNGRTLIELISNNNNTVFGDDAGFSLQGSPQYTTLIGDGAGRSTTSGTFNTMLGDNAGFSNTTGSASTLIGRNAGYDLTGVNNFNTMIGYLAGSAKTSGLNSVFIGSSAGQNNTSGSGNIFIGYQAGMNETGANKLYIANSSTNTPLIYGEFNNRLVKIDGDLETTSTLNVGTTLGISGIIKYSETRNLNSINGNSSDIKNFTITGAAVGDVVHVSPRSSLGGKIVIAQAWVSAANTVSVRFRNVESGSENPPNITFDFMVFQ